MPKKEVLYVFGERYVIYTKSESKPYSSKAIGGAFKTKDITVHYSLLDSTNGKCIVLRETRSKYPLALLKKDTKAITEAIRHIAEKEKFKVMQSRKRPDFGYEIVKTDDAKTTDKQNKPQRRFNIIKGTN